MTRILTMPKVSNMHAQLIAIEDPIKNTGWVWPTFFYYLGGNVFSESNDIITLERKDITEIEAIIEFE